LVTRQTFTANNRAILHNFLDLFIHKKLQQLTGQAMIMIFFLFYLLDIWQLNQPSLAYTLKISNQAMKVIKRIELNRNSYHPFLKS
jgi:hypothetical protein